MHRGGLWTSAPALLAASCWILPAAAEICSIDSVPKVRFCGSEEFCCGNGCCPRSMISFFKLAIGVVLLVMIMIWFCSYLRRAGRHRDTAWLRPPTVTPPPPYTVHGSSNASVAAASRAPYDAGRHPTLVAFPGCTAAPRPSARVPPAFTVSPMVHSGGPALPDDLPPPYHTVVNMPPAPPVANSFVPPPYLPPYDGHGKTTSVPT